MLGLSIRLRMIVACALSACVPGKGGETDSGGAESSTGETDSGESTASTGPTGGETSESLLETCVFDPPCAHHIAPDITESELASVMCAWETLRDAAPARVDLSGGKDESLFPLGDPQRSVLVIQPAGAAQRCTLAAADFFQTCIDEGLDGGEGCFFGSGWYADCVTEPEPVCPGA